MDYKRVLHYNVFENLEKIDEDGRKMSDGGNVRLSQTLRDFSRVDNWIEKVGRVASETRREMESLKCQIAEMWTEIDENEACLEASEEGLDEINEYFRVDHDDDSYLQEDHEDQEGLRCQEDEGARDSGGHGQGDLEAREAEEGKDDIDEDDQDGGPWQTQRRGRKREKRTEASGGKLQRRRRKVFDDTTPGYLYLDDLVFDPRFVKDAKHKAWEVALEVFISELRNMVHYSIKPSREEVRTVDKLMRMLSQMRIAESEMEQIQVRWDLEDGLTHLLEDANRKFRRMGI